MPFKDPVARAAYNACRYQSKKTLIRAKHAAYYQQHKAKITSTTKRWKAEHHERVLELNKAEYRRNIERKKAYARQYAAENKDRIARINAARYLRDRERILRRCAVWASRNRGKVRFYYAKRRAAEIKATPSWLAARHYAQIAGVYIAAHRLEQEDGIKRHVDHIYPLQGKTVRGLHVPWNLQILEASKNQKKSNKIPEQVRR